MKFNPALCEGCPLEGKYEPLEARGPEDGRFLIVTDVPSQASARDDRLMTKYQAKLLKDRLEDVGFDPAEFRFIPVCHCAFDPNAHVNKEKTAAIKHCRQHFLAEVENNAALEAIIPLGATAASQAFGKATKITKVRGVPTLSDEFHLPIFPLMSPAVVAAYPQNESVFRADIESLGRNVDHNYNAAEAAAQQTGEYEIVDDLQFLIDADPEVIAFDTENTGLRWYQEGVDVRSYKPEFHKGKAFFQPKFQILTMQFSIESGKAYMLVWDHPENPIAEWKKPKIRNQLRKLLCDPKRIVVGQGAKYDDVALWMTEGIRFRISGDTLMLATLLDENMPERNLDVLTKIHVPEMAGYADWFNATYNKERMWEVPLSDMTSYGCGDADATLRLYNILEEQVAQDEMLWAHYTKVSLPGLNAFAALETRGMYTDQGGKLAAFKETISHEVAEMEKSLLRQIPKACKQEIAAEYLKKNRKATVEKALSFSRPDFLKQVLFTSKHGFRLKPKVFTKTTKNLHDEKLREPSTSAKDHLPYFFDECPFTVELATFQKLENLLNTNVIKFEENYIRQGKVRPTYGLHKAVTGRSNSEDPNGQNYPKRSKQAKAYREIFAAPPGYYIIEGDLSQAELRIAACMSGDPTMIKIYRSGGDIHRMTGAIVAGLTMEQFDELPKEKQKEYRQKAKAVNFGFLYGMGWKKFIGYAKTDYGVTFTEAEAQRIRKAFFAKYRSLEPWHKAMRQFAHKHKFVRSFSGRVRHLPMIDSPEEFIQSEAERQGINSPVQEFGSSLGVMAQGRINEEIDPDALMMVGFIHDALVAYVKCEYVEWGMKTLKRYMETNPIEEWFGVKLKAPIIADVSFGTNLGQMHECEGLALDKPFDFTKLKNKDTGELLIKVPKQKTPPNNGRLTRSPYTLPTDLEPEDEINIKPPRIRRIYAVVPDDIRKREDRSQRQMMINRRNRAHRDAEARQARYLGIPVVRRVRPTT